MKITSRTPPVRIEAAALAAIAALPPEQAGLLLRWGIAHYGGDIVEIDAARAYCRCDDRAWHLLMQALHDHLDQQALNAGRIVVVAFAQAADRLARVSAARVRGAGHIAKEARIDMATGTGGMTTGATARADPIELAAGRSRCPQRPPSEGIMPNAVAKAAPTPPVDAGPWEAIAGALVARGAAAAEVETAVADWRQHHMPVEVFEAIAALSERRVAKPVRYVASILANDLAARRQSMPPRIMMAAQGALVPRAVKRRITVPPRAGWTFEGWTARGHAKGGIAQDERRGIWRNDSGTLSYKRAEDGVVVPSYEEDPGLYETD